MVKKVSRLLLLLSVLLSPTLLVLRTTVPNTANPLYYYCLPSLPQHRHPIHSCMASPPMAAPHPVPAPVVLDPKIWLGCAGDFSNQSYFPCVGELVYYFPQGHMEQAECPPGFLDQQELLGHCKCRVISARLYATAPAPGPGVQEIYFELTLDPSQAALDVPPMTGDQIVPLHSFSKKLSATDANGGAPFRIPQEWSRFCKLPKFEGDEEKINLAMKDMYGKTWTFDYKKSGSKAAYNHLTQKSWSRFTNQNYVMGKADSLVLIYDEANETHYIGIRWGGQHRRGKVQPEEISEALTAIKMKKSFTVKHYPRYGYPDFVVKCDDVNSKMDLVAENPSIRLTVSTILTFDDCPKGPGTIVSMESNFPPWPASPWRALKVNWDRINLNDYFNHVSAWQVEVLGETTESHNHDEDAHKLKKQKVGTDTHTDVPSVI